MLAVAHTNSVFFPKLIIRVPHNGLFDAEMKTLETIENAQVEFFFILIIRVPHDIIRVETLPENEIIVYMNICSTHLKLKQSLIYVTLKEF